MYLDATLMFSQKEALTKTATSNAILLKSETQPITSVGAQAGVSALITESTGSTLYPFVHVTEDFVGLTSLTIEVQTCDDTSYKPDDSTSTMPADANWLTVGTSKTYALANLNKIGVIHLPPFLPSCARLMRLRYVVVGTPTAGSVSAGLVLNN